MVTYSHPGQRRERSFYSTLLRRSRIKEDSRSDLEKDKLKEPVVLQESLLKLQK